MNEAAFGRFSGKLSLRLGIALLGGGAWLFLIITGFGYLLQYENTPGLLSAQVPKTWPAASRLAAPSGEPVLLMLLHPKCPCSRASVQELEKMMTNLQGRVRVYALFVRPEGFSSKDLKSALWRHAEKIPGVTAVADDARAEVRLFGASLSGETFLYGANGNLVFHGGLTAGRGHEGPNAGQKAVVDFLRDGKTPLTKTFAFGCSLWSPHTREDHAHEA
jgi:hypothetical protein